MNALEVSGLTKVYPKFKLDDVSFSLEQGYIMGFIGENGAGKTTTLKAILNLITLDGGEVRLFDKVFRADDIHLKHLIGCAFGGFDYYTRNKIKTMTQVIKRFYPNWDDKVYEYYMKRFKLDDQKRIIELSEGMKVKYNLAIALSHGARLLILDEPTSGLDPISRDELLTIFQELILNDELTILFSTHITSDLEKCADFITYIQGGKIVRSCEKDAFIRSYRLVQGDPLQLDRVRDQLIAYRMSEFGFVGLALVEDLSGLDLGDLHASLPTLEDIMIYHARREGAYV